MSIIEIENLTYSYPAADKPILRNVSLRIEKGDFLAIVGNNGCGKSTLCKTLNGLIPHFIAGEFSGSVRVNGIDTREADVGSLARRVGYVYQDFENQIVRPTVLDDASYACLNYAMSDYREQGCRALSMCGLEGRENDYVWQLSGGQTHLLALAGAVSLGPEVLILDEPIAQLDPGHADRIYHILKELNEKYGKTIIVIEHHTEYIADYCKHVVLMRDGSAAWKLPAGEALRRVEELEASSIFPPQVTMAARKLQKEGQLDAAQPLPTTIEEGKQAFGRFSLRPRALPSSSDRPAGESVFEFRNVSASYPTVTGEKRTVFDGLNLTIRRGERIALIGSNGAGKSTLMKMMLGLVKPQTGELFLHGESLRGKKPEELSGTLSLVYQNPEEMFIKDSIESDIAFAMQARGISDFSERTRELLQRFRLTELAGRDGRLLSGGQMRRASLAIGVALHPEILLLDEPTANLDVATRKEIVRTIAGMKDAAVTAMIATHDMQLVCEWAERVIVLHQGRAVADGTRDEIFSDPALLRTVGIRPPEIFSMAQSLEPRALCYTIEEFTRCLEKE